MADNQLHSDQLYQSLILMKEIEEKGLTQYIVNSNAFKDFQTELQLCLGVDSNRQKK